MHLSRRDFLKLGAAAAVMAATGCGDSTLPPADPNRPIVGAAIHPALGIARVGNAADGFFFGPELPGELPAGPFKAASGAILRQAARFRVYGLDAQGLPVRELTAAEAEIAWTVHLTNEKAAWYDFETALDIPEAVPTGRRNADVQDRSQWINDPGPRTVVGPGAGSQPFDSGQIMGQSIYLGELQTDGDGRLIVLGGRGRSFSPTGAMLTTFANNDGWTDDISDGPVTATVTFQGQALPVQPAWVVVAPPNYGPAVAHDFRTLFDVVTQTMIEAGYLTAPTTVSFLQNIYPLFDRLSGLQWVNAGILERYGWGSPEDFSSPALRDQLADPSPANRPFREAMFARFRNPDFAVMQPEALPPIYGDAVAIPADSPRDWIAVTPLQFEQLRRWAAGDFVDDRQLALAVPQSLSDLPLPAQPAALDRAALEACLAGAFHPGCEVTWPIRNASLWGSLYRLKPRAQAEPDYGDTLTPGAALAPGGPLDGLLPGGLSRWMAVPWQSDTASCRSGYEPEIDPYLPTFWAPRVPNHVLAEADYQTVLDTGLPLDQRQAAFNNRQQFFRAIDAATSTETLTNMVRDWYKLGLVENRPGPPGGEFPAQLQVESEYGFS